VKSRWVAWVIVALAMTIALDAMAKRRITHEVSMLIRGAVNVDAEGRVSAVEIDHAERLDAAVLEFVERQTSAWVFQPVVEAGAPAPFRTLMALRLVLKPVDQAFEISIPGIVFFDPDPDPATVLEAETMLPPRYPPDLFRAGLGGHVYVAVQVDASGKVRDAVVEQVNLTVKANSKAAKKWRDLLTSASLGAAKAWKFKPPGRMPDSGEFLTHRVPLSFWLGSGPGLAYGQWEPYFPGPRMPIPWPHEADAPGFSPDVQNVPRLDPGADRSDERSPPRSVVPPRARLLSVRAAPAGGV